MLVTQRLDDDTGDPPATSKWVWSSQTKAPAGPTAFALPAGFVSLMNPRLRAAVLPGWPAVVPRRTGRRASPSAWMHHDLQAEVIAKAAACPL
jgi:hypothetical protein